MEKKWLSTTELARYLGFERQAIASLREQGMPCVPGPGVMKPRYRYDVVEVEEWLKKRSREVSQ